MSGSAAHWSKLYYSVAARLRTWTFAIAPTNSGNYDLIYESQYPILIDDGFSVYKVLAVGIKKRIQAICAAERSYDQCGKVGRKRTPNTTADWENHSKWRGRDYG